ncbi:hypothetical protein CCAX7_17510 [Capsulimonas corticalis]|uniref:Uncharacterized protein n=1 Tax=Capsulimonas corticalis TaxID=2219043 RepID=A0A402D3Y6_9BACT|nr:hypothetical protein [Capsulimonas corticalis]BDI29700.1 hypothetical protein CCAX7_17510 [Capsulimonas corticalis]
MDFAQIAQILSSSPEADQQQRGLLQEVMNVLSSRGVDPGAVAQQAGVPSANPSHLPHQDLIALTQHLLQQHPEIVQQVAQRFPAAQSILGMLGGQAGEDVLGGLLGRL